MKMPVSLRRIFRVSLLLCSFQIFAHGQPDTLVLRRPVADTIDLRPFGQYFPDSSQQLSFPEIRQKWPSAHRFSFSENVPGSRLINGRHPLWLHFTLINVEKDSLFLLFGLNNQTLDSLQIWQVTNGKTSYALRGIATEPDPKNSEEQLVARLDFATIAFPPGQTTDLWIRVRYKFGFNDQQLPALHEFRSAVGRQRVQRSAFLVLNMLLASCLFVSLALALIRSWQTRGSLVYLYYAACTVLTLLYQWITTERMEIAVRVLPNWLVHGYTFRTPVRMGAWAFYLLFIQEFLRTRIENTRLHRLLGWMIGGFLGWVVVSRLLYFLMDSFEIYRITYWFQLVIYSSGIALVAMLFRSFNRLSRFILTGTLAAFSGALVSSSLSYFQITQFGVFDAEEVFVKSGIIIALFCIWLGLGERENELIRERAEAQQKLIDQLHEINILKENARQNLETRLAFLSQQLKPHFLFNTLNSIRNFIGKGKTEEAEDYLVDFATLLRQTLDASEKEKISLEEELAISKNYLKMEQLRFRDRFDFEIRNEGIDLRFVDVPPLILQPFVENAIRHGLLPKEGKGQLFIEVFEKNGHLTIAVDDDGIGRTAAKRDKIGLEKTSHGLRISRQHMESFNELFGQNLRFDIIDKMWPDGSAAGTRVEISF